MDYAGDDDEGDYHDFSQEDHQVAFIFEVDEREESKGGKHRPSKRRRVVNNSGKNNNGNSHRRSTGGGGGSHEVSSSSKHGARGRHEVGRAGQREEGMDGVDEGEEEEDDEQENAGEEHGDAGLLFAPLLNGAEGRRCVRLRQRLFEESWGMVESRIRNIMRESNTATLDEVSAFVNEAGRDCGQRIPSAFIVTGPNFASQDLLFEQLSERLQSAGGSRFVRLRSTDAPNVKAALKKVIRDATSQGDADDGGDDLQVGHGQGGRRFLDYDLEALEAYIQSQGCEHVFVGFQDSEAFDSGLLSDLIFLLSSWRPEIPFTLLFGIATSVELLQARLLKSACRLVYGAQFDGIQTDAILESVFRGAVASSDVPLRLGGALLQAMLDRQHDHVAGIQAFISSLKYAYMCHFYANPLSILLAPEVRDGEVLAPEHYEALRNLPSIRSGVEKAIQADTRRSLAHARSLVESDKYLLASVLRSTGQRRQWLESQLRFLLILDATRAKQRPFSRTYIEATAAAWSALSTPELSASFVESIRQMTMESLARVLERIISVYRDGEPSLHLRPGTEDVDLTLLAAAADIAARLEVLRVEAEKAGITALRSKYSSQGKVMRMTIIAQRVQLRRDSAALRPEDVRFTELVDRVVDLLAGHHRRHDSRAGVACEGIYVGGGCGDEAGALAWESWVYESKSPLREVMVPRPRGAFERSLARPHDYLSCACCTSTGASAGRGRPSDGSGGDGDGDYDVGVIRATLPATCILYHLYLEAGCLINVSDLWSAFRGLVGVRDKDIHDDGAGDDQDRDQDHEPDHEKGQVRDQTRIRGGGPIQNRDRDRDYEHEDEEEEEDVDNDGDHHAQKEDTGREGPLDERQALVMFYRGLAELKALGFVKASRKKTDHIAKVQWL